MVQRLENKSLILIPILILFGVNMFLAATNVSRWVAEDSLESFTRSTAQSWAKDLTPRLAQTFAAAGGNLPDDELKVLIDREVLSAQAIAWRLYDADNKVRLVSDRIALARAEASPASTATPDGIETSTEVRRYIDVKIPLSGEGTVNGTLQVYIDQTAALSLFYTSHKSTTILSAVFLLGAVAIMIYVVWNRIREQWSADEKIRYLAHHDGLTGLKNRTYFEEHLNHAITRADADDGIVALLTFDIDKFKQINDSLGHATGDALLKAFADRLTKNVRKSDLVCRLGGDEFAIALHRLKSVDRIVPFANRLCRVLGEPYVIDGNKISTSSSIGIAVAPDDGLDASTLFACADLALYRAKEDGRNTVRLFEPEMDERFQRRRELEREITEALGLGQFELHYQPQYDMMTGELRSREALVRWNHPVRGMLQPEDFLPIAEETGQIIPLSRWILDRACRDAMKWEETAGLAVNLSAVQFRAGGVAELVRDTLNKTGFPASRLELEITETVLLDNSERVRAELAQLKTMGATIVMDDFGTGYSSLSYLASFPIDKLKIDRSFVQGLNDNHMAEVIVNTIINLGRDLELAVTAEGVETLEQEAKLRAIGCSLGQGFLYGRPAPIGTRTDAEDFGPSVVYPCFGAENDRRVDSAREPHTA